MTWKCALELDSNRSTRAGSDAELCDAIRRGADLRIYTEFRNNEHVDLSSDDNQVIREMADFPTTYLVEDRWSAGVMTLRQPVSIPTGFGPRASMSFFLYNQDGQQGLARPYLEAPDVLAPQAGPPPDVRPMPKYHLQQDLDQQTCCPSRNFIYDFDVFRYFVRDAWKEVLAHGSDGSVTGGSVDALAEALRRGQAVKVAVRGLCDDLPSTRTQPVDHELFVSIHSSYYYTQDKLFIAASNPLVRVTPAIPMVYSSGGWDFGWVIVRTDGLVTRRLVDPHTSRFCDSTRQCAIRWFVD